MRNVKLFLLLIIISCLLSGCIPGMNFFIKNLTDEYILIKYSICDDLLLEGFEKNNTVALNPEDETRIVFSWNSFYNRGITQNDYKYTSTFLSIFEDISIEISGKNVILRKEEIEKYIIKYRKEGVSAHIFTLEVGNNE